MESSAATAMLAAVLTELQELRQEVQQLTQQCIQTGKRKRADSESDGESLNAVVTRHTPVPTDCRIQVSAKDHQDQPCQVSPVFIAPVVAVADGALVHSERLKCCTETGGIFSVLTLPKSHNAWVQTGSKSLRVSYAWPAEIAGMTDLPPDLADLVAEFEDDIVARTHALLGLLSTPLVLSPAGPSCWDNTCGLYRYDTSRIESLPFSYQLAKFVEHNSMHVPVIFDPLTGTTQPLTLCHARFSRAALSAWSLEGPWYLASLLQVGYRFSDNHYDDPDCEWRGLDLDGELTMTRGEPDMLLDIVDLQRRYRDTSKCSVCYHSHDGMCTQEFAVNVQGCSVHLLPRLSGNLGVRRPHVTVSRSGVLEFSRHLINFTD